MSGFDRTIPVRDRPAFFSIISAKTRYVKLAAKKSLSRDLRGSTAGASVSANGNIIKKVYFPREIIPISVVTAETINFLISTIIILGFVILGRIGISKYIVYYPIILTAQYLVILAISFIISSTDFPSLTV